MTATTRRTEATAPAATGSWWSSSPRLGSREIGLTVLAGCVLALVMHMPLPLHMARDVPKDVGDTLAEAWQLAWDGHALLHQPLHFFESNQFYPAHDTRAYVDGLIGYVPVGWIGSGPVAAIARLNVLFLFAYALAFIGAYLLGREFGLGRGAAAVVGVAFAYAPYRLEHDAELNILSSGGIPLSLFLGLRGYRRHSSKLIVAAWLVLAWQVALSFNLALPFAYMLAIVGAVVAVTWFRRRWAISRPVVVATLVGVAAVVVIDGAVARPYQEVFNEFGPRSPSEVAFYSTGPRAFLAASKANMLWGRATAGVRADLGWEQEETLFPGAAIVALSLIGLIAGRYPRWLRLWLAGGTVVAAWLSLGFPVHGSPLEWPYRLLYDDLPGWNAVRVPERIWLIPMLLLALLAGAGAAALLRAVAPGRLRTLLAVALAGMVLIEGSGFHIGHPGDPYYIGPDGRELVGGPPTATVPQEPPGQRGLPGPQLHLPLQVGEASSPRVVLWSTDGFAQVATGIGSESPPTYSALQDAMRGFPDRRSVATLRRLRYRVVVLHPDLVAGTAWAHTAEKPITGLGLTRRVGGGVIVYWLAH